MAQERRDSGSFERTAAHLTDVIVMSEAAAGKKLAKEDIWVLYAQSLRKVRAFSERME